MSPLATSSPILAHGRELVQNLLVALRSSQLYEPDNDTMRSAAQRLARSLEALHRVDGHARLEAGADTILVNGQRIRPELRHYSIHANLLRYLKSIEIGGFEWRSPLDAEATARFAHAVGRDGAGEPLTPDRIHARLQEAGLDVEALPQADEATDLTQDPDARRRAEKTYRHGVAVTRELMESMRAGRSMRHHQVKRAVQSIVDQVLEDESLLVGLTNLRDYDQPTFTHSVNVCIFAVALGQKIGLSRFELYDLGMAALLHDIGKVDVPPDVLLKPGGLEDAEWAELQKHPRYGALRILRDRPDGSLPVREMLAAFEHHLNIDLSGYPTLFAPRKLAFYSKIIAICDSFDAGTTPRVYKTDPIDPAEMLEALRKWEGVRYDPVLLKAFISLIGIYPAGTLVLLDTMELALVVASDPEPRFVSRPRVKLVADPDGSRLAGPVVSLAETAGGGEFARTVIKVLDPERYGIDPARHFLTDQ